MCQIIILAQQTNEKETTYDPARGSFNKPVAKHFFQSMTSGWYNSVILQHP